MYTEMPRDSSNAWESDVALFIDWENLKFSLSSVGKMPNISALIDAVGRFGRLVIARAYADWEDPFHLDTRDQMHLYDAGIEPVYVPTRPDANRPDRRKNSVDVKMSTDCMEVSYANQHITSFVLVSGDADFIHIANSLRSRGNRVIMIGVSWSMSHRINEHVDDLVYYDRDIENGHSNYAQTIQEVEPGDVNTAIDALVSLVREQREEGRYPLLSWLGHQMRRQLSGFCPQAYGFEKFKDLVRYAEQKNALKIVTHGLVDWAMLPDDDAPTDTMEETNQYSGSENPSTSSDSGPVSPEMLYSVGAHPVLAAENPLAEYSEVFADIVRTADEIEKDGRYDFMTPGFLGQCLWRKGHWDPTTLPPGASQASETLKGLRAGQIRKLIDFAVEEGVLLSSMGYDPNTGKTFPVIRLNHNNPFVTHIYANGYPESDDEDLIDEEEYLEEDDIDSALRDG
jgi:uncharacterized LabA/DUF88 family protein